MLTVGNFLPISSVGDLVRNGYSVSLSSSYNLILFAARAKYKLSFLSLLAAINHRVRRLRAYQRGHFGCAAEARQSQNGKIRDKKGYRSFVVSTRGPGGRELKGRRYEYQTKASVQSFQTWGGVTADGIVGDETWSVSLHALSSTLETAVGLQYVIN
jgi:hypothetical protein